MQEYAMSTEPFWKKKYGLEEMCLKNAAVKGIKPLKWHIKFTFPRLSSCCCVTNNCTYDWAGWGIEIVFISCGGMFSLFTFSSTLGAAKKKYNNRNFGVWGQN
jgi:hypothetical protein